ncbi:hypothetical protein Hypma_004274 [Hypsizygus marmoreus]|uniref:Uncharacterized protein n=1 Tax=Hypsizygus marmoreus TaxID=39966 RepID=A0A369J6X7_HYPMA|nr:hypothetical protein Hypma_004274 [Hypsizygus marmoreus]
MIQLVNIPNDFKNIRRLWPARLAAHERVEPFSSNRPRITHPGVYFPREVKAVHPQLTFRHRGEYTVQLLQGEIGYKHHRSPRSVASHHIIPVITLSNLLLILGSLHTVPTNNDVSVTNPIVLWSRNSVITPLLRPPNPRPGIPPSFSPSMAIFPRNICRHLRCARKETDSPARPPISPLSSVHAQRPPRPSRRSDTVSSWFRILDRGNPIVLDSGTLYPLRASSFTEGTCRSTHRRSRTFAFPPPETIASRLGNTKNTNARDSGHLFPLATREGFNIQYPASLSHGLGHTNLVSNTYVLVDKFSSSPGFFLESRVQTNHSSASTSASESDRKTIPRSTGHILGVFTLRASEVQILWKECCFPRSTASHRTFHAKSLEAYPPPEVSITTPELLTPILSFIFYDRPNPLPLILRRSSCSASFLDCFRC